jgi:Icc-related predicted phosphoesterase
VKIQLISDVHVEFDREGSPYELPEVDRDVLVIAGDLGEGINGIEFLNRELERSPVIYVLGNHEFYRHYWQDVREHWREHQHQLRKRGNRLFVLDDASVELDGVRFVGSTLWADFDGNSPVTKVAARRGMNDYNQIGYVNGQDRLLTPEDTYQAHVTARQYIADTLAEAHPKTVVVTHHAPSPQSIPVGYRHSSVNGCYVSDLEELIHTYQPAAWCHGHTHVSRDYKVGETRILCNPRGYAGYEANRGFSDTFTFTV